MYHKYRLLIHAAITALIMAFIFYQSSLPAILSSEMSGHLERIVAWILGKPSESVTFAVRSRARHGIHSAWDQPFLHSAGLSGMAIRHNK